MSIKPSDAFRQPRETLEHAVHTLQAQGAKERIDNMEYPAIIRRGLTLLSRPALLKALHSALIDRPYERAGYEVIGSGIHSTVVADGHDAVIKVYRNPEKLSEAVLRVRMHSIKEDQAHLLSYFEEFAPEQTFDIGEHPLKPDLPVITGRQERIHPRHGYNLYDHPDHSPKLRPFMAAAREVLWQTAPAITADLLGRNNLLLTQDERVVLVDTLPVHRSKDDFAYKISHDIIESYPHDE